MKRMKRIKTLILALISLFICQTKLISSEEIKLYPSGNVVCMNLNLKYPYVRMNLNDDESILRYQDMIASIEYKDKEYHSIDEIYEIMKLDNKNIKLHIIRNESPKVINITSNKLREYQISDTILGIGTITAIDENGRYIAVAHKIRLGSNIARIKDGLIYEAGYIQEIKSNDNGVGNLVSSQAGEMIGTIDTMTDYGIKGTYKNNNSKDLLEINKPQIGKAYIYCETPITNEIKMHEIEITNIGDEKSEFIIKDTNLIKNRGGGVIGMSGSPIIQDNKIVGGMCEIIIEDAKKGKFVNIGVMIKNNELTYTS